MAGVQFSYYRNYNSTDATYSNDISPCQQLKTVDEIGWSAPSGKVFKEWNISRDGTGESFSPGSSYEYATNLYAIWEDAAIDYLTTDQEIASIANAIRTKGGTSSSLVYPDGFVSAIEAISTGTDVSDTTATAGTVRSGYYFYTADGTKTQGTIATKTSSNLTVSGDTVTVPAGYYASQATKSVATGFPGVPTASKGVASNGSIPVTPSVTNETGYITGSTVTGNPVYVTAGDVVSDTTLTTDKAASGYYFYNASGSKVQGSLTAQAAQTITPTATDQTIASGKYLTGTQTIKGDSNLVAANIALGTTIFGVAGSFAGEFPAAEGESF